VTLKEETWVEMTITGKFDETNVNPLVSECTLTIVYEPVLFQQANCQERLK
jgi:hypothetical protein